MNAHFTLFDWVVLIGYFFGITAFGLWISRKMNSSEGYFMGGRKLPWWVMVGQSFGTGTNAENPVAQTGACFHSGFATIWYQWKNILITPFYWLIAPWYRRTNRTTIGEVIDDRYGRPLAIAYTIFAIAFFVFNQGAMLKGAGKIISVATGGEIISPNGVVVLMTVAFILYSFFGGLVASAYTDFVQGFMIIGLSFMLIPMGLLEIGGFQGLRESIPSHYFDLYSAVSGLDAFTIAMLSLNGMVGITAMPHMVTMFAAGKNERAGRVGMTYGSIVKRFCTIGWALTGLIVAAMIFQQGISLDDPENAFGFACLHLLGPGLTGLMVACVLAANMSTCSNFMVNTGALFTKNIYIPYIRPQANDKEMMWTGRFSGLALTLLGVVFALYVDRVLDAFLFTETIAAFMGIMFMGGILWRRANRYGAMAATLLAFATYYAINYSNTGHFDLVYRWAPAPFGWAMLAGTVSFIFVSLITPREEKSRLDKFFNNMLHSSDTTGQPDGAKRPLAADLGQDLLLNDLPGWFKADRWKGFFHRYREDLIGFVLAIGSVVLLVLFAWGLMQVCR